MQQFSVVQQFSVESAENGFIVRVIWKDDPNKIEVHVADSLPKLKKLVKAILEQPVKAEQNAN